MAGVKGMDRVKGMGRIRVGVMVMEEILCRERVKVRNLNET